MRYLVYLLVLANLGLFAWYQSSPIEKPRQAQPAPLPAGVDRLMLLSERAAAGPETTAAEPQVSVVETDTVAVEPEVVEVEPEPQIEPEPETETAAPVVPSPPPERICQTLGPLPDKNTAAAVSGQLYKQGYKPAVREEAFRKPAGYWVYMPAMSAGEARRIVRDLDQHGMKDYFIGRQNHISLGIFSSRDKARARQKKIRDLGYTAKLDQRFRNRTRYWLDIAAHEQALPGTAFWDGLRAEYPDIQVQQVDCE